MWNRAYYEARVPGVPTMLLELLSHQNFADMRLGHDPRFKFLVSRAVYKGILRYVSSQYDLPYVVRSKRPPRRRAMWSTRAWTTAVSTTAVMSTNPA